jgi:hydroxyacylglutathione hydrolase
MTGDGNNTWLLDGGDPALIDAGVGISAHIETIARALDGRPLANVYVTHGHRDHASGVPALRARWPAVAAWKWPDDGDERGAWHALEEGQVVVAGAARLRVLHTPGHARDHVCFWDADTRALYAGDMLVAGSTVMIPGAAGGGMRAYLASLERLAELGPQRVYAGHGPIIYDPAALIAQYIAHRREREAQVRVCVAEGVTGPDAIVARLYPDLPASLRPAARLTVEAHLLQLHDDGL